VSAGTDLDVAVVGAGMAGLTAAAELQRAGMDVRVFESCEHVGGRTATFRRDGYLVDTGAEQISPSGYRATWRLIEQAGLGTGDLPRLGGTMALWRDGRVRPGVAETRGMLTGAGLSPRARLDLARFRAWAWRRRAWFDTDHPERSPLRGTTIAEFARRYHPDLHDYLLQPVAGTFFGWSSERSAAAVLISLLLAVGEPGSWRTYRDGMDTPARLLAADLDVRTGTAVHQVVSEQDSARLETSDGTVRARSVLLCVPAPEAARVHANPDADASAYLAACSFAPALKVSCMLDRPLAMSADNPPYVLLTPAVTEDVLSAVLFDHVKHPGRAPAGKGLLTLMPAARTTRGLIDAPDEVVRERLVEAAARYLPELPAADRDGFVHRHRHGLPEATPEALHRRPRFMQRPVGPVDYAGDWVMLRPASEGAVRSGALAASRALSRMRGRRAPAPA